MAEAFFIVFTKKIDRKSRICKRILAFWKVFLMKQATYLVQLDVLRSHTHTYTHFGMAAGDVCFKTLKKGLQMQAVWLHSQWCMLRNILFFQTH